MHFVFGDNLRVLTGLRGSVSAVARSLDINRVQYNRYLKGESFPKPAVLKQLCDFFGVDARIYTDPLTPEQMAAAVLLAGGQPKPEPVEKKIGVGVEQAVRGLDCDVPHSVLPDGLHKFWRLSYSDETKAVALMVQVKTIGELRVCRLYEVASVFQTHNDIYGFNTREIRGILVRGADGFSFITSKSKPSFFLRTSYFSGTHNFGDDLFYGLSILHRDEYPSMRRVSRTVLQLLPQRTSQVLSAARSSGLIEMADVPERIAGLISRDIA